MQHPGDFRHFFICQPEFAGKQDKGCRQQKNRKDCHHQAKTENGLCTLDGDRAGLIRVAGKTDQIQTDAGEKYGYTGGCLDYEGLHGEDHAFFAAAGFQFAVVYTAGEKQGSQYGQHTVAGKDDGTRDT